ncbi:MAG: hypothetical protein RMM53_04235 [Bacteroidia bacterium]|nr:hypothetical protein [Bacteroidia bacterium]MDW8333406.1 hypothetical protein [Bacteroidia bacterium]
MNEKDAVKRASLIAAYLELRSRLGRTPSPGELARQSGLGYREAMRLIGRLNVGEEAAPARLLTASVVEGLAYKAMQGDAKAAELFFKYAWGVRKKNSDDALAPTLKFPDGETL